LTAPPPPPAAPLTLRASALAPTPARPIAGKTFVVRIGLTRSDTGGALASGRVTCKATLGLRQLPAIGSLRAGKAGCVMRIPGTGHGKRLRGTIKVTFRDVSLTKSFAYRVP
jgi:hypothetical protein